MKKLALTSLLAVFAVSGAHAANVIDGNPLYMPGQNHFYSVSTLGSHTGSEESKTIVAGEEFGYGITDKLGVMVRTNLYEYDGFDAYGWNDLTLGATYRVFEMGPWKADLIGAYTVSPTWEYHSPFLDKGLTDYTWTLGARGGFVASNWTVAAHALFNYTNSESFNWNEDKGERGIHTLTLGVDGQYVFDSNWSAVAGVEYLGVLDKEYKGIPGAKIENAGTWTATAGVNYNIDATKFVGAYVSADMNHQGGDKHDEWKVNNGFGFGAKFGIDF